VYNHEEIITSNYKIVKIYTKYKYRVRVLKRMAFGEK